jgi:predicted nicotinamide N-methyase
MRSEELDAFIRDNLSVSPVPGVPEIRLHKARPDSGLKRLAEADEDGFGSPYWAYHWAGGLALARYVLDHPETVAGKNLLDLGAGGGLVGIAAAKAGAAQVTAAEVDPYAVAALRLNAALNRVRVEIVPGDLTSGMPLEADVVLVGDMFYAPDLAARVTAFLDRCAAIGQTVLVGDPWRAYLPADRLREVARYAVVETANPLHKDSGVFAWPSTCNAKFLALPIKT